MKKQMCFMVAGLIIATILVSLAGSALRNQAGPTPGLLWSLGIYALGAALLVVVALVLGKHRANHSRCRFQLRGSELYALPTTRLAKPRALFSIAEASRVDVDAVSLECGEYFFFHGEQVLGGFLFSSGDDLEPLQTQLRTYFTQRWLQKHVPFTTSPSPVSFLPQETLPTSQIN